MPFRMPFRIGMQAPLCYGGAVSRGNRPRCILSPLYRISCIFHSPRVCRARSATRARIIQNLEGNCCGWLSFGEYDPLAILQMPENASAAARGACKAARTTSPLLTLRGNRGDVLWLCLLLVSNQDQSASKIPPLCDVRLRRMGWVTGFEPATSRSTVWRSTS